MLSSLRSSVGGRHGIAERSRTPIGGGTVGALALGVTTVAYAVHHGIGLRRECQTLQTQVKVLKCKLGLEKAQHLEAVTALVRMRQDTAVVRQTETAAAQSARTALQERACVLEVHMKELERLLRHKEIEIEAVRASRATAETVHRNTNRVTAGERQAALNRVEDLERRLGQKESELEEERDNRAQSEVALRDEVRATVGESQAALRQLAKVKDVARSRQARIVRTEGECRGRTAALERHRVQLVAAKKGVENLERRLGQKESELEEERASRVKLETALRENRKAAVDKCQAALRQLARANDQVQALNARIVQLESENLAKGSLDSKTPFPQQTHQFGDQPMGSAANSTGTAATQCDLLGESAPASTGTDSATSCGTNVSSGVAVASSDSDSGSAHPSGDQPMGSTADSSGTAATECDLLSKSTSSGIDGSTKCATTVSSGVVDKSSDGASASAAAGKKERLRLRTEITTTPRKIGIRNTGNLCPFISILQLLRYDPLFRENAMDLARNAKRRQAAKAGAEADDNTLATAIGRFYLVTEETSKTTASLNPGVLSRLCGGKLQRGRQQDASEVLSRMFDVIMEKTQCGQMRAAVEAMTGEVCTVYKCQCGSEPFSLQPVPMQALAQHDDEGVTTLTELLQENVFETQHGLDSCDECSSKETRTTGRTRSVVLQACPEVLLLQLSQGQCVGGVCKKLTSNLDIPLVLDVGQYTEVGLQKQESVLYDLVGVVHHTMWTHKAVPLHLARGHYSTFVATGAGEWCCYDDDTAVRAADPEEVLGAQANILMYLKRA